VINGVTTIQSSLKTANIGDIASDDLQIIILCKLSCCLLRGTEQAGSSRYKYSFILFFQITSNI